MRAAVDGRPLWEPLYDAVAFGMWAYSHAAFRVETAGALEPSPGLLLVSTHRAESDVPVICPVVYGLGRYLRDRHAPRLWFAARDDMFERGFFAGFPPELPRAARRVLYPLRAGPWLPRVRVAPVPYPGIAELRLGRALEELPPHASLREVLGPKLASPFAARAREARLGTPRVVADVLRGEYADLLWRYCTREELPHPALAGAWQRRGAEGASAIRQLVELHRSSGGMLLVFPEGRPSPDGAIGPLQPGLDLLVRRGRPSAIAPLALAYDPLTRGRTRVVVSFGAPRTASEPFEARVLAALRQTMPLTAGQAVASAVLAAARSGRSRVLAGEVLTAVEERVREAVAAGRPLERALAGGGAPGRVSEALGWLLGRGLASAPDRRGLELEIEAVLADATLRRLACEHAQALL